MDIDYKCVLSVGMRCYTEIYLKQMGLKKFSGPFDALYFSNITHIIYLLENRINPDDLIHTELINNTEVQILNKIYGFRTIHRKINTYDENNMSQTYHLASFAHHNLNDVSVQHHFDRCFARLDKIKQDKIKTLFCIFSHPNGNQDKMLSMDAISIISTYLHNNFNCHVLVIVFLSYSNSAVNTWKIHSQNDCFTYIVVNNGSIDYDAQKNNLKEIFSYMKVNENVLFTYNDMKTTV
jgi:hypothetical protein